MRKIKIFYILIIFIAINIISSKVYYSIDLTDNKRNTLNASSKKILNTIDDDIYFKIFLKGNLNNNFSQMSKNLERILINMKNYNKNIKFIFINPMSKKTSLSEIERNNLMIIESKKIKKNKNTKGVEKTSYEKQIIVPGCIMYYKNKASTINFINTDIINKISIEQAINELEYKIIKTIKKSSNNQKSKIAFIQGHKEVKKDKMTVFHEFISKDYEVEYFNIQKYTDPNSIKKQLNKLKKYKAVIITKPLTPFTTLDNFLIDQYIMNGGKTIWMIDGTNDGLDLNQKNKLTTYKKLNVNLNDILINYGAKINNDLILDSICDIIHIGEKGEKKIQWPYFPIIIPKNNNTLNRSNKFIKTKFISSIDIKNTNNNKKIILSSSNSSYKINAPNSFFIENYKFQKNNITCGILIEGEFQSFFKNYEKSNTAENFKKINKIEDNKMIIISDGDIIIDNYKINSQSGEIMKQLNAGNKEFMANCINYVCDDFNLIELKNKNFKLNYLNNKKIINKKKIQITATIIPIIIILIIGYMFNFIRKNKNA